jgi:hypothetical protein
MPPEPQAERHWVRAGFLVWVGVVIAVCTRAAAAPERNSVYPIYALAGRDWASGQNPYRTGADRPEGLEPYRYSPPVSAFFVPFTALPNAAGGVVWRLLSAAVYLGGCAWFCATVLPSWQRHSRSARAGLWLLLVPLSVGSLANGQANALVAGLLLAGTAAAARRHWSASACLLAAATLFKGYPLALGLLFTAIHPLRFGPRYAAVIALGLAVPFATQEAEYVGQQYRAWAESLEADDRKDWPLVEGYRDLWHLGRAVGLPMDRTAYLALQVLTAAAAAVICLTARRRGWDRRSLLTAAFSLGIFWMILCGPATESSTYTLLAPIAACTVLGAIGLSPLSPRGRGAGGEGADFLALRPGSAGSGSVRRPGARRPPTDRLAIIGYGLLAVAQASSWFPFGREFKALGPEPLGALLLLIGTLGTGFRRVTGGAPRGSAGAVRLRDAA